MGVGLGEYGLKLSARSQGRDGELIRGMLKRLPGADQYLSLLKNMFGPGIVTPMIATGTSLSGE